MNLTDLKPGIIIRGPMFPEPVEVLVVQPLGDVVKLAGAGQKTGFVHQRILHAQQIAILEAAPESDQFDGNSSHFKLGIEAARLGLAYEVDPNFSLSIARVDPLPHQLEAVYDYFLKMPRIRFLLADDPGAGKTIMAGLLLKEMKVRGLVKRTLIVAPANLTFQWQRELKDKFREQFDVVRGDVLRTQYGRNPWQERNQVVTSVSWISRVAGVHPSPVRGKCHVYKVGKVPKTLNAIGERLEPRFGKLGREYQRIVFDKHLLGDDATLEWVTPGHPLFEAVRGDVADRVDDDLRRGAVFWDLHAKKPYRLDVYSASVKDGCGNTLHKKLFVVRTDVDGTLTLRQPTLFLDLIPSEAGTAAPTLSDLPERDLVEVFLVTHALNPFLAEVAEQRTKENAIVREHIEISLNTLIDKQQIKLGERIERRVEGQVIPAIEGNIKQAEDHLDELNARLERRRQDLEMERHCSIGDMQHAGRAWVLPHPERETPNIKPMVSDPEVEEIAVRIAMDHERARGWEVESVENENRGHDLLSKKPHATEPGVFTKTRFIEVKGRSGTGEVALTANEYRTAQRLGEDFWLYVVFDCAVPTSSGEPKLNMIQNPARLGWEPVVKVEHYQVTAKAIMEAARE